jgi:hypothetical protein
LCIEGESDNKYILGYAETNEVTLNKGKLNFADTENVIPENRIVFMQVGRN